jgi:AcrR family transcriptional regulator
MRPQKVENIEMLDGLMSVLRSKGYDGSSLNELAEAAGLKKASLYHRFPGGKKEMTASVLDYVHKWVRDNIYLVLIDSNISPIERLNKTIQNIRILYNDGGSVCIIRALSMGTALELFGEQIQKEMQQWIDGFKRLALDLDKNEEESKILAVKTLVLIQGSLVVAKGLNSKDIFTKNLQDILHLYVN